MTKTELQLKAAINNLKKATNANIGKPCSETTKQKISAANKGHTVSENTKLAVSNANKSRVISEETRKKMSDSQKRYNSIHPEKYETVGKKLHGWYSDPNNAEKIHNMRSGIKMTDEWKANIGKAHKGKKVSEETREKISKALTGRKLSEEHKHKVTEALNQLRASERYKEQQKQRMIGLWQDTDYREKHLKMLSEVQFPKYGKDNCRYGKHHSNETKQKMSKSTKQFYIDNPDKRICGKDHPSWKGGSSFEPYCPKFNKEFRERVRAFFNYTCLLCGVPQNGRLLGVHHCNYNKNSCCDTSIPLFVPLCASCHTKTNHDREYWQQHFTDIINTYYQGKCYLSKEEYTALTCHS